MAIYRKKNAITFEALPYTAADTATLEALIDSYGADIKITGGIVFVKDTIGNYHELADTDRAIKLIGDDTFVEVVTTTQFADKYEVVAGTTVREKTTVTYNAEQYLAVDNATLKAIVDRCGIDNVEKRGADLYVFGHKTVNTDRAITLVSDDTFIEIADVTKFTDEYEISV